MKLTLLKAMQKQKFNPILRERNKRKIQSLKICLRTILLRLQSPKKVENVLQKGNDKVVMVDCALFAVEELMRKHKECLLYGQDVGGRLGGVFREAATLAQKFGDDRVFNTPIQEAFIVGSTVGMSAVGLKPIVEVQFADYIWPGLNQLFTEVSRSAICLTESGQ